MNNKLYVHYGCGIFAPSGWRNFDNSPTLYFERLPIIGRFYSKNETRFPGNVELGDIVKGLPINPESCEGVYCSHVLEHLSLDDFRTALQNTLKILRSGGIFRFVLPDLELLIKQYSCNPSKTGAIAFMRETGLGREKRKHDLKNFIISWLGNSQHLWMWDYRSIEPELINAGFINIRRAYFGDSADPMFQTVEDKRRWDNCLGIECKKPG